MSHRVRVAKPTELPGLVAVELAADGMFAEYGIVFPQGSVMEEVTDAAAVLVVGDPPIAFAYTGLVDEALHLHQLAVHPDHGRRGVGTALLSAVLDLAGSRAVTLTTYREIPWNAPWYAKFGFVELDHPGPELTALVAAECAAGLDGLGLRVILTSMR